MEELVTNMWVEMRKTKREEEGRGGRAGHEGRGQEEEEGRGRRREKSGKAGVG